MVGSECVMAVVGMESMATERMIEAQASSITDLGGPASPTSTDGWGEIENGMREEFESDKDGWDDVEPLEESKPFPALVNIQAAQKRPPVSHLKPQGI